MGHLPTPVGLLIFSFVHVKYIQFTSMVHKRVVKCLRVLSVVLFFLQQRTYIIIYSCEKDRTLKSTKKNAFSMTFCRSYWGCRIKISTPRRILQSPLAEFDGLHTACMASSQQIPENSIDEAETCREVMRFIKLCTSDLRRMTIIS